MASKNKKQNNNNEEIIEEKVEEKIDVKSIRKRLEEKAKKIVERVRQWRQNGELKMYKIYQEGDVKAGIGVVRTRSGFLMTSLIIKTPQRDVTINIRDLAILIDVLESMTDTEYELLKMIINELKIPVRKVEVEEEETEEEGE